MFELVAEVDTGRRIGLWRQKLSGHIYKVGRAWDNDLVIDDPYVDPYHLEIVPSIEGFWVRDLNTKNGTLFQKKKMEQERLFVDDISLKIGRTKLRLVGAQREVPPAKSLKESKESSWKNPKVWLIFFWSLLVAQNFYFDSSYFNEEGWVVLLWMQIVFAVWGGVWVFIGKVFQAESKFWEHQGRLARLMTLLFVLGTLRDWAQAFFLESLVIGLVDSVLSVGIVGSLLVEQINSIRPHKQGEGKLAFFVFLFVGLFVFSSDYSTGSVQQSAPLKPKVEELAPAYSQEEFNLELEAFFETLKKEN